MATADQSSSSIEIERKYDVDDVDATFVPSDVIRWGATRVHRLVAIYLDTAAFTLQQNRITLRCRTGGSDEGWHLKRPGGGDARRELHAPLAAAAVPDWPAAEPVVIPPVLAEQIAPLVVDQLLYPVARLATHRTERDVMVDHPGAGDPLGAVEGAVVCDDLVSADVVSPATGRTASSRWREWEVELIGPGDIALLDAVEVVLLGSGGRPAGRASKLARALAPVLS